MRSIFYSIPPRFRRIFLLVSLILLALIASIQIALPFGSGAFPQANALSSGAAPSTTGQSTPHILTPTPKRSGTPLKPKPTPTGSSTPSTRPGVPSQPTPTPTRTAPRVPTPTPVPPKPPAPPAPAPTSPPPPPPAPGWKPLLQQGAPNCNNPAGTVWGVPSSQATSIACTGSGTLIRQATSTRFAETDLNAVNGTSYDQNTFRLQLQIAFPAPIDGATNAAIILRTPASGCGGFIFTLAPSGHWGLQDILTCTNIPTVVSGTAGINPSQPTTVTIQGQNQALSVSINGAMVLSPYGDGANVLNGGVGLMVERPGGTSSLVQYSNLELDAWR